MITGQTECYYLSDKYHYHKPGTKFLYLDIKQFESDGELYVKAVNFEDSKKEDQSKVGFVWLWIENLFFPEHVELTEIKTILNLD